MSNYVLENTWGRVRVSVRARFRVSVGVSVRVWVRGRVITGL